MPSFAIGVGLAIRLLGNRSLIAAGEGYIDFARETLDLRIGPSVKHGRMVEFAAPFAIEDSLVHPTVEARERGATARAFGRVVSWGSLLPIVNDRGRDHDNPCLATL